MKKITIRIDGIEDDWEELKKIVPNSSEFLRKCITDKVRRGDKLTELRKEFQEKELEEKLAREDKERIAEEITKLQKIQANNVHNDILMGELIETAKRVDKNEGLTYKRVIAIAQDKVTPKIFIKRLEEEGIHLRNEEDIEKQFVKNSTGGYSEVKTCEEKDKTSLEKMINIFKRRFKSDRSTNDPIKHLISEQKDYEAMLRKYEDLTFSDLKKVVQEIYR